MFGPSCLRRVFGALGLALFALSLPLASARGQVSVLTQHNDNARTGANLQETLLTPYNVNVNNFGKLFVRAMDANVNGQVLYVPNVTINGVSHNVIFAYTSNNSNGSPSSVYAFDADDPAQSTPLWRHQLPNSAQWTTAAPVIDLSTNTLFALTKDNTDSGPTRLRALDITTGNEKSGSPITIAASVPGTGDGSSNGVVSFNTAQENCRPGLLLIGNTVYLGFAHNSDSFPYHGWVFAYSYDQTQFTQTAVFCTTPNGGEGGIWQSNKGLAADAQGNIYCTVGNGSFDANAGGSSYGMCVLKLDPASLHVSDWFAPYDEQAQSNRDADLANIGPLLIPGTNRLFVGATKFGSAFLLDSTHLGGFTPNGPDNIIQRLDGLSGTVGQNPVVWDASGVKFVYNWAPGANLQQFRYDPSVGQLSPAGVFKQTSGVTAGGGLSVTANGGLNGIVWAQGRDGVFHAFDATDVTRPELWNSRMNSARDSLGSTGKWQFPTVVNGKAYVPTNTGTIAVYGLLPAATAAKTHVLWNSSDGAATVWNLDMASGQFTQSQFGPYTNWQAKSIADGPDGRTRVLWTNADGMAAVWSLNNAVGVFTQHDYGPYPGWAAQAVSVGPDNQTRVLWTHTDGRMALWSLNNATGAFSENDYGPYADAGGAWRATAISVGFDNKTRILWNRADAQAAIWSVDTGTGQFSQNQFGPYTGFAAEALAAGPDQQTRVLWNRTDGYAALWSLDDGSGVFTQHGYGPYGGWTASALSTGSDNMTRVLWNRSDGAMSVWNQTSATGAFVQARQNGYGPYPGWTAIAVSAYP